MSESNLSQMLKEPAVQEIFAIRRTRYILLSTIVCVVYVIVAIGCAFAPELMRRPILPGSHVSIGITSMALIIIVAIVSSGYYTWWSNTVRDPLLDRLKAGRGWKA